MRLLRVGFSNLRVEVHEVKMAPAITVLEAETGALPELGSHPDYPISQLQVQEKLYFKEIRQRVLKDASSKLTCVVHTTQAQFMPYHGHNQT